MFKADKTSLVPYLLVGTHVRVRGTRVVTADRYSGPAPTVTIEDVHVDVVHRAGTDDDEKRRLRTGSGSQTFDVQLTPDGRLQSIEYNHVGSGAAVVTAGAKLVAFVGSIAASVAGTAAKAGALAGGRPAGEAAVDARDQDEAPDAPPDPRADWKASNPEAATLLETNKSLAQAGSDRLAALRTELLSAPSVRDARDLTVRIGAASTAVDAARAEVSRIETIYLRWREAQSSSSSISLEVSVPLRDIPRRAAAAPLSAEPATPPPGSHGDIVRDALRVLLEVVDSRPASARPWTPVDQADDEQTYVRWRVPRTVDLLVWAEDLEGTRTLVQRCPITVADDQSDVHGMHLREGAFGKHGGSWTFGDDGALVAIRTDDESAVAAAADAFASVPDTVVAAVQQAKTLTETISGMQDAAAERAKAGAERDLATAKAKVDLLGVNATAEDAAALARAEQTVKLRTATRSVSAEADQVADLKQQLELTTAQADLATKKRQVALDDELAALRADVARLEEEVLVAKARHDKKHPGDIEKAG